LRSFSTRELFADFDRVDAEWLDTLIKGAANPASRYAVFRFIWVLATGLQGGYCHYYSTDARGCRNTASSISRQAGQETRQRLADYLKYLQRSRS